MTPISRTPFALAGLMGAAVLRAPDMFFAGGRLIHGVQNGDTLPVWIELEDDGSGSNVKSSLMCDFDRCSSVFANAAQLERITGMSPSLIQEQVVPGISPKLIVDMWTIFTATTMLLKTISPHRRMALRERVYTKSPVVALSDILQRGLGECVEQSAMAKYWLDRQGHRTMLLNHAFQYDSKPVDGMMHAMVVIKQADGVILMDPANAMGIKGTLAADKHMAMDQFYVPTLYIVPQERWDRLLAQGKTGPAWIDLRTDSVWKNAQDPETAWVGFALPNAQTANPAQWLVTRKAPDSKGPKAPTL